MSNLRRQLVVLLEQRGMTAAELSRRSGVSRQLISSWQGGTEARDIGKVKKVAEALRVSLDTLLFGEGIGPDEPRLDLGDLIGDGDWLSATLEIRVRRVKFKP